MLNGCIAAILTARSSAARCSIALDVAWYVIAPVIVKLLTGQSISRPVTEF